MRKIYHSIVRNYLRVGFFFYFRKVHLIGIKNIPENDAIIFTSNHQNALVDALLIAVYNGRSNLFLTRASVFKNPFIARILNSLNMYPVFRVRDGWSTLDKNQGSFQKCIKNLSHKGSVVIFPEGNHDLRRRLRPLSKGFTRIAFGTLDDYPDLRLFIVPVGINYQNHTKMGSSVSIYFGEPILANGFHNAGNFQESSLALKTAVYERMKRLISHLPEEGYEQAEMELSRYYDFLDPETVNEALASELKHESEERLKKNKPSGYNIITILALLINFVPLQLRNKVVSGLKDPVFEGTVKYVFCLTVFPLFYLFLAFVAYWQFSFFYAILVFGLCCCSLLFLNS